jgi:biopolymer transport protein ExbB
MSFARLTELAAASGGILFIMPLMLLIVLTVSFERSWYLGRTLARCRAVIVRLAVFDHLERSTIKSEIDRLKDGPVVRLLSVALNAPARCDRAALRDRFEEAIMLEVPGIDRSLWMLDTVVTLAPLLGLLGTIIGMFNAFQVLGKPGSAPTEVTGGVAEALIATASGLLIAIIGIVFFNGLQNRVRLQVHELETLKTVLVNRLTTDGHAEELPAPLHLVAAAEE